MEIGRVAGRMVLARLAGETADEHRRGLPFQIMHRESTSQARS
jgi:DNA-binding LacI/PurR family transcriptional regulator